MRLGLGLRLASVLSPSGCLTGIRSRQESLTGVSAVSEAHVEAVANVGPGAALTQVASLSALRSEVCRQLDDAVITARATGASWSDVGRAAGMTRQAAHERWASCTVHLAASSGDGQRD